MATSSLRRLILGERLPTARAIHERLPKYLALPVFASDAISSSAYAVEEILLVLVAAGAAGVAYSPAVAAAICLLFAAVAISYRQTVMAYPSGGGAYIVAHENLGVYPGLVAAAALLTDYVLTVAVSIAAGVAAIISAAPALTHDREALCLGFIAFVTLANLRGARESGRLFAGPTYLFVGSVALMVAMGAVRLATSAGPAVHVTVPPIAPTQAVGLFLMVRAFAGGCAALTGIEAISNGIPAFRPPESRNAATTLAWMAGICIVLFFGIATLARLFHIVPDPTGHQTVVSMVGRAVFGNSLLYYILQAATAGILLLAANTSFADFPRLSSILARDGFAPRQLANLGDRLVFSNGILLLGVFAGFLIVVFRGQTHLLIPLYAVGVFISFTLSQAGMVRHWRKLRTPGWRLRAGVNAAGALATAVVFVVVGSVKFTHGAWIILVVIPLAIVGFHKVSEHYHRLATALKAEGYAPPRALHQAVLVLVPSLHKGVLNAIAYARSIAQECEAVFVEIDPAEAAKLREAWAAARIGCPLTVLKSPWRSLVGPITDYIRTVRRERHVDVVTVVIPEFATARWWHKLLHNQSGLMLKLALMREPGVIVINVRYHLGE